MSELSNKTVSTLIDKALDMLQYSYTPYSGFKVGAALLAKNGTIYGGCNIENAAYTPCSCAERTAFFKAVSEGVKEFDAIAVVGGPDGKVTEYTAPCGVCRQVMMEWCDPASFQVFIAIDRDHYKEYLLEEILPDGFGPGNLKMKKTGG
ncbi:MAG: cytidine deaminase [Lachnospiraceae bacterium]|nr:cytidine deaminase [Lachnospiraceae bacterium]